jgi:hypothetical protein
MEVTRSNYMQAARQAEQYKIQAEAMISDPNSSDVDLLRAQQLMNKFNQILTAIADILHKEGIAEGKIAKNI